MTFWPCRRCRGAATGFDLKVLYLAESESNRGWDSLLGESYTESDVLNGWHAYLGKWEIPVHLNWGAWREIVRFGPDVIVSTGYENPSYWLASLYARVFGHKYILWSGTTLASARQMSGPLAWLKRFIISSADAYYAYGTRAAQYLESFGASSDCIHVGVNTVDMDGFQRSVDHARCEPGFSELRNQYPPLLLLYSGQLIPRKGVGLLLEAMSALDDDDVGLMIVGGGGMKDELRRYCDQHGLERVYFIDFQQYDTLPTYYALADACVLPSASEVWGLVVNEALASGLYVVCSNRAGAGPDLVKEGWNGTLFDPSDADDLANQIKRIKLNLNEIRGRRSDISDHACREFSIEKSAEIMLDAIKAVCQS